MVLLVLKHITAYKFRRVCCLFCTIFLLLRWYMHCGKWQTVRQLLFLKTCCATWITTMPGSASL